MAWERWETKQRRWRWGLIFWVLMEKKIDEDEMRMWEDEISEKLGLNGEEDWWRWNEDVRRWNQWEDAMANWPRTAGYYFAYNNPG